MTWMVAIVVALVLCGSVLAMAETSVSRMNRVRALSLVEEGRKGASLLVRIEQEPARYLNSIYLSVMLCQNGSAILVAIIADREFDAGLWITMLSIGFTLAYFVVVEAMSKTFGILHSDGVALALAPLVVSLARVLALPTRALIGLANWLLPGKGLKQGPFVSEEEIRTMAEVAAGEATIEEEEKEMIHSIFEFGDTVVREVMVPRPDMAGLDITTELKDVLTTMLEKGFSRMPVWKGDNEDEILGLVYARDVMRKLHGRKDPKNGKRGKLKDVLRPAMFVPESKKVAELLREMQAKKTHMAIVVNEYGDTSGLVTMEDLLEEIVGEIADEYDREEPQVQPIGDDTLVVNGRLLIDDLSEMLDVELPDAEWDTVGGLMSGLLGRLPSQGDEVTYQGLAFRAERVQGRRIAKVRITKLAEPEVASGG